MDLFNREIISFHRSKTLMAGDTVIPAFKKAFIKRKPVNLINSIKKHPLFLLINIKLIAKKASSNFRNGCLIKNVKCVQLDAEYT